MEIRAEGLAYWYFRLNGFLNIPNFVVHPDEGSEQRTDVDLLGVRFPYRAELLRAPMRDDDIFRRVRDKAYIVLGEVKTGICNLNGPWTIQDRRNMQRVLRAVGALPEHEIELAAASLYESGTYRTQLYYISLFCLGNRLNEELSSRLPDVPQIVWPDVLSFIYERFRKYRRQKLSHPQWDAEGQGLWMEFESSRTAEEFLANVRIIG